MRVLPLVLLLAVLLACKKKAPDPSPATTSTSTESPNSVEAKKLLPQVKERLSQLKALDAKTKSEPAVRVDKPFKEKLEKEKVIILGDKWVPDVGYTQTDKELKILDATISLCNSNKEKTEFTTDEVKWFKECVAFTHVAVIRPKKIAFPKMNMAAKTFEPGEVNGDMLLFELSTGEIKGRYKLVITNSDKVTYIEGKGEDEWQGVANSDLVDNVVGVTRERLALERESMWK